MATVGCIALGHGHVGVGTVGTVGTVVAASVGSAAIFGTGGCFGFFQEHLVDATFLFPSAVLVLGLGCGMHRFDPRRVADVQFEISARALVMTGSSGAGACCRCCVIAVAGAGAIAVAGAGAIAVAGAVAVTGASELAINARSMSTASTASSMPVIVNFIFIGVFPCFNYVGVRATCLLQYSQAKIGPKMKMRDYQEEVTEESVASWKNGSRNICMVMPTGVEKQREPSPIS